MYIAECIKNLIIDNLIYCIFFNIVPTFQT